MTAGCSAAGSDRVDAQLLAELTPLVVLGGHASLRSASCLPVERAPSMIGLHQPMRPLAERPSARWPVAPYRVTRPTGQRTTERALRGVSLVHTGQMTEELGLVGARAP